MGAELRDDWPELVTQDELAGLLHVSRWWVYRRTKEGVLPGVFDLGGGTVRYDARAVRRWLADRERGVEQTPTVVDL